MSNTEIDPNQVIKEFELLWSGDMLDTPEDIRTWLGRALLLYGVPFNYLVPDETMLPAESIRFFSLDPGWLKCLLEGACSVGRHGTVDEVLDRHLRNNFLDIAGVEAGQVRAGKKETLHWPLTGFLLRSSIVEGWQGLEMTAYAEIDSSGKLDNQLLPLRLDRLGPDIMLCIFNGKVNAIEIKQPPEGLHFGAAAVPGENEYRKISLRRLHPAEQAGNQIGDEIPAFDVPMREGVNRVIDINKLASEMEGYLQGIAAIDGTHGGRLTSAEFAVQMVDSPCKAMFTSKK